MKKKLLSLSVALVLMVCSVLSPSLTAFADTESESSAAAEAELFYSLPYDDGYTDVLGISQAQFLTLKEALFTAAKNFDSEIDITKYGIVYTQERLNMIGNIYFKRPDRPDIFQINRITCSYRNSDKVITKIKPVYNRTKELYDSQIAQCEAAAEEMLKGIKGSDLTDLEKALLIHDRIAKSAEYVNTGADDEHNICGVFIDKKTVCEGYTQAYCYLLLKVGISSRLSHSAQMEHAWNLVTLNGVKYNVDLTWDDPLPDIDGRVRHISFLCSTQKFKTSGDSLHDASDYNTDPVDTRYDNAFWNNVNSSFELLNGKIYFINASTQKLCRYSESEGVTELCDISDRWICDKSGAYYDGSHARLAAKGNYLYYNLSKKIMRYDPATGETKEVYSPDLSSYAAGDDLAAIYGFKIEGDSFVLNPAVSPNFDTDTKKNNLLTVAIPQDEQPPEKTFKDVWFKTMQQKTEYYIGDSFDPTGMELFVRYSDDSTEPLSIDDCTVNYDFSAEGQRDVSITYKNFTGTFGVTVKRPSVTIKNLASTLKIGESANLTAVSDPDTAEITFESSNPSVAEISENKLIAKSAGRTTITAKITLNGIEYTNSADIEIVENILYGDVNGDGRITSVDALIILRSVVKSRVLSAEEQIPADVDKSGSITAVDALLVLQFSFKKITSFPAA